jgi:uncharacterized membrane protein YqjE
VNGGSPATPPGGGLRRALARFGTSSISLLRTRLELASVEFQEERERTVLRLVLTVVAVMFFAFAVLSASALVVVLYWDTHRAAALAGVMVLHAAIGAGAWWRLKADRSSAPPAFAATLAELERDGQWLAEALRDRTHP